MHTKLVNSGALANSVLPRPNLNCLKRADQLVSHYWRKLKQRDRVQLWGRRAHFEFESVKQHIGH